MTFLKRLALSVLVFACGVFFMLFLKWNSSNSAGRASNEVVSVEQVAALPAVAALTLYFSLSFAINRPAVASAEVPNAKDTTSPRPLQAQVVGVMWLNPLQRRDYPTEWQLLWTLGLVRPNIDDDMLKAEPDLFSNVQAVSAIASGREGIEVLRVVAIERCFSFSARCNSADGLNVRKQVGLRFQHIVIDVWTTSISPILSIFITHIQWRIKPRGASWRASGLSTPCLPNVLTKLKPARD